MQTASTGSENGQSGRQRRGNSRDEMRHRPEGESIGSPMLATNFGLAPTEFAVGQGSLATEVANYSPYLTGCSFDSTCWPEAGTAVSSVKKTRRSTIPEMIRTSPTRKRPMVSGRFDRDVRIICTAIWVQAAGQTPSCCNGMKTNNLTRHWP